MVLSQTKLNINLAKGPKFLNDFFFYNLPKIKNNFFLIVYYVAYFFKLVLMTPMYCVYNNYMHEVNIYEWVYQTRMDR